MTFLENAKYFFAEAQQHFRSGEWREAEVATQLSMVALHIHQDLAGHEVT